MTSTWGMGLIRKRRRMPTARRRRRRRRMVRRRRKRRRRKRRKVVTLVMTVKRNMTLMWKTMLVEMICTTATRLVMVSTQTAMRRWLAKLTRQVQGLPLPQRLQQWPTASPRQMPLTLSATSKCQTQLRMWTSTLVWWAVVVTSSSPLRTVVTARIV
jgi:hypothetical protein